MTSKASNPNIENLRVAVAEAQASTHGIYDKWAAVYAETARLLHAGIDPATVGGALIGEKETGQKRNAAETRQKRNAVVNAYRNAHALTIRGGESYERAASSIAKTDMHLAPLPHKVFASLQDAGVPTAKSEGIAVSLMKALSEVQDDPTGETVVSLIAATLTEAEEIRRAAVKAKNDAAKAKRAADKAAKEAERIAAELAAGGVQTVEPVEPVEPVETGGSVETVETGGSVEDVLACIAVLLDVTREGMMIPAEQLTRVSDAWQRVLKAQTVLHAAQRRTASK